MKYIFIFFFSIIYINVTAQNFIDSTKQWNILHIDSFGEKWMHTYSYKFKDVYSSKDTVFAKLYFTEDEGEQTTFRSYWWETADGRVFQYITDFKNSSLMYDFNLEEQDTFFVYEPVYLVVDSVRIKEWGGKERKHWYFHSPGYEQWWGPTTWVEGVGQLGNFTSSTETNHTGSWRNLLCFWEKGSHVYQNPDYNRCWKYLMGVHDKMKSESLISILPLGNKKIKIYYNSYSSGRLDFFNLSGQKIKSIKNTAGSSNSKFTFKNTGIYIYKFMSDQKRFCSGKIVID